MKTILIFLFSCIAGIGFSQKQYAFDYLIEYEVTHFQDSLLIKNKTFREKDTTYRKIYLTNSKQSNYLAILTELDSLTYVLNFKDNDGVSFSFKILKNVFHTNEFLEAPCELVSTYINPNTYQTKNYDFIQTTDTIINDSSYWRYKLTSNKPKRIKKLKLGTEYYIIDKATGFHSPILEFSTAYEEWKIEQNLPKGILFKKYFIDFHGNLDTREKLRRYRKIKKEISIDAKCDYSRN